MMILSAKFGSSRSVNAENTCRVVCLYEAIEQNTCRVVCLYEAVKQNTCRVVCLYGVVEQNTCRVVCLLMESDEFTEGT
jgi:hypothetical protein